MIHIGCMCKINLHKHSISVKLRNICSRELNSVGMNNE